MLFTVTYQPASTPFFRLPVNTRGIYTLIPCVLLFTFMCVRL